MAAESVISLGKQVCRYLMYGKQIGKTAANGNAVYRRNNFMTGLTTLTGIGGKGNVIKSVKQFKTGPDTIKSVSTTYLDYGAKKQTECNRSVGFLNGEKEISISWFSKWLDKYGIEFRPKGKGWCGQIYANENKVSGCVDYYPIGRRNFDRTY